MLIKTDHVHTTLVDPHLQIKGGGGGEGGHPDPEIRRGGPVSNFFLGPSGLSLVHKKKQGRGGEGRGDFSAISTTERSSASPIPKVESHLSDRC